MIIAPVLPVSGFAIYRGNCFFVKSGCDDITPSHELGHCNGLSEYVVDIGVATQQQAVDQPMQYISSNIMGYADGIHHTPVPLLKDFYSWQISVIRERIKEQLNK